MQNRFMKDGRKNILFYVCFTGRSRDTETLMLAFEKQGHRVLVLNQQEGKQIHSFLQNEGVDVYISRTWFQNTWLKHIANIAYLVYFCWKHNITVVYSHLEPANFIAVFAQFFVKAKVYICRHHSDLYAVMKKDTDLSYRLIYRLARKIIVVSENAKRHMVEHEKVKAEKIMVINLAYDFSIYPPLDHTLIGKLRQDSKGKLTLITVGQLIPVKRPEISLKVLKLLIDHNIDARLFIVGQGQLLNDLMLLTDALQLADKVVFTGHVPNVLDYLSASDILLHPSASESSCVVIKEAGLVEKPVIICRDVGDFDDFMANGENGFIMPKDSERFIHEAVNLIMKTYTDSEKLSAVGRELKSEIITRFGIDAILPKYDTL